MTIYIDIQGTLDRLSKVEALAVLVGIKDQLGMPVVVWSGSAEYLDNWAMWLCAVGAHWVVLREKELTIVNNGDVVVDDDEMIRKAVRRRGARTFTPEDLPRLAEMLSDGND